jgi:hypothetical protein
MNLVVSCVAEDTPKWVERVRMLALSLRRFGGGMADAPLIANFVGSTQCVGKSDLKEMGVSVRTVAPVHDSCPWANKLRMLELPELASCDLLLALDCDVVVMGDVRPIFSVEALGAVPEGESAFTEHQWGFLSEVFGVKLEIVPALVNGLTARSYVNSGVLGIPSHMCRDLRLRWEEALVRLDPVFEQRPHIGTMRNFADQIALALAIESLSLKLDLLPQSLNCHTGGFPDGISPHLEAPFILHYHNQLDAKGFLKRSGNRTIDREIQTFNRARAELNHVRYVRPKRRSLRVWMEKQSPLTRKLLRAAVRVKAVVHLYVRGSRRHRGD